MHRIIRGLRSGLVCAPALVAAYASSHTPAQYHTPQVAAYASSGLPCAISVPGITCALRYLRTAAHGRIKCILGTKCTGERASGFDFAPGQKRMRWGVEVIAISLLEGPSPCHTPSQYHARATR
eukprot:1493332-Rhodomonas_salina.2